jgi:glycosyltransferase involved in cell wall biosynthesis
VKIAYFCQYFVPESAAPASRVSELSHAWAAAGHDVTVVTGLPNHPTGIVPEAYRGVVFRKERLGAVAVWRNLLFATPNEGFVKKTLGHLSFMLSTLVLSVPRLRDRDVLIVSSPSFFVVMSVCVAHWLWRTPYVFEVRDLWPGVFVELGILKNRFLIGVLEALEMFLYRHAARVVVVTESFRDILIARGLPPGRVAVITNGVDTKRFGPDEAAGAAIRRAHGLGDDFVVLYIGAHGISHALSCILQVARRFEGIPVVRFVFVGDGAEKQKLTQQAADMGLRHVTFVPSQPRDEVNGWYNAADVVLVPLRDIPLFDTFIPSKMFEILACARPIVASVRGEARGILERSGGALVVDPEDADGIAGAIDRLRADPSLGRRLGEAGRAFVGVEYDRDVLAQRYVDILQGAVADR